MMKKFTFMVSKHSLYSIFTKYNQNPDPDDELCKKSVLTPR